MTISVLPVRTQKLLTGRAYSYLPLWWPIKCCHTIQLQPKELMSTSEGGLGWSYEGGLGWVEGWSYVTQDGPHEKSGWFAVSVKISREMLL